MLNQFDDFDLDIQKTTIDYSDAEPLTQIILSLALSCNTMCVCNSGVHSCACPTRFTCNSFNGCPTEYIPSTLHIC